MKTASQQSSNRSSRTTVHSGRYVAPSLPLGMLTLPSQVPDLTLFNLFDDHSASPSLVRLLCFEVSSFVRFVLLCIRVFAACANFLDISAWSLVIRGKLKHFRLVAAGRAVRFVVDPICPISVPSIPPMTLPSQVTAFTIFTPKKISRSILPSFPPVKTPRSVNKSTQVPATANSDRQSTNHDPRKVRYVSSFVRFVVGKICRIAVPSHGQIKDRSGHITRTPKTSLHPPAKELECKTHKNAFSKRTDNLSFFPLVHPLSGLAFMTFLCKYLNFSLLFADQFGAPQRRFARLGETNGEVDPSV
jgi:hypothetical protein